MYRMPVSFMQSEYDASDVLYNRDSVEMLFTYTTDGDMLSDYLPEGFELLSPELSITFAMYREISWLAGGSYNLISASVPARFKGKRDRLEGSYNLVTWENKTTPIIGGREDCGVPKIYADIEDLHINQPNYFTNASLEGNSFLHLYMDDAKPVVGEQLEEIKAVGASVNLFGWRYIHKVGGPGADLSQPILYPQGHEINSAWIGSGRVQWTELSQEQNPTQWNIIKALSELPIIEMKPVIMVKCVSILKPYSGRVLE